MAKNVYDVLETVATKGFPPIWFPHILPEEAVLKMQEVAIKTLNKESDQMVKLADATVKAKVAEEENKLEILTDEKEQRESKEEKEEKDDESKEEKEDKDVTGGSIRFTEEECSF